MFAINHELNIKAGDSGVTHQCLAERRKVGTLTGEDSQANATGQSQKESGLLEVLAPSRVDERQGFWRSGLADEAGGIIFEVGFEVLDACHLGANSALALLAEHLVLNQTSAEFDDLDIGIINLPELALGQRLRRPLSLNLHFEFQTWYRRFLFICHTKKTKKRSIDDSAMVESELW